MLPMTAELSQLMQQLSPAELGRMQTLMHNMMGGFDVTRDMEEFERSLPADFRAKIVGIMMRSGVVPPRPGAASLPAEAQSPSAPTGEISVRDARLTVLRGVASGSLSPEDAEKLLFPDL